MHILWISTVSLTATLEKFSTLVCSPVFEQIAFVDFSDRCVSSSDFASHRVDSDDPGKLSGSTKPHSVTEDSQTQSGRDRITPPMESFDYLPHLLEATAKAEGRTWTPREGLKPLHVVQPEGVSFVFVSC